MSMLLSAALAAQTVLALVLLVFAIRAWSRVKDSRLGFLAIAFVLLLGHTVVQLIAAGTAWLDLEAGLTIGTFFELGAFLALYMGILRP